MLFAFFDGLAEWFKQHPGVGWSLVGFSVVTFLSGLVILPIVIVRIPPDYFSHDRPPQPRWQKSHPMLRYLALAAKNLLGAVLVLAGVVMLITPGPGWVCLLLGLALLDVPGKRKLERKIVGQTAVFGAINKLRAKYGHPPLEKPR